jgi:hypothetical protein
MCKLSDKIHRFSLIKITKLRHHDPDLDVFANVSQKIYIIYLEYQSVCPIVGIGTPSPEDCVSPFEPSGGGGATPSWG